jgi:hypothetical protein
VVSLSLKKIFDKSGVWQEFEKQMANYFLKVHQSVKPHDKVVMKPVSKQSFISKQSNCLVSIKA